MPPPRRKGGPLAGLRIVVTRAPDRAPELSARLRRLGASVIEFPAIEIREPRTWRPVDREIARLAGYDALVFTSRTAVERFFDRLRRRRVGVGLLPRVGAVGPGTATALCERGVQPAWLAPRFTTRALGRRLRGRVLHPTSNPHSPDLAREARRRGAVVVEPVVYRIVRSRRRRRPPPYDVVTFASAGTARHFAALASPRPGTAAAYIGPVTARAARSLGFRVVARPTRYTIPDLANALVRWVRLQRRP